MMKLEEMDWNNAKTAAENMWREARMTQIIAEANLKLINAELKKIWDALPEHERKKRKLNSAS